MQALAPVFANHFQREAWLLRSGDNKVECVIDQGALEAGDQRRCLTEVEMELKQGDPACLFDWAGRLVQAVPAFLNVVSKAEQGYHLGGLHHKVPEPPLGEAGRQVDAWFRALSQYWLTEDSAWLASAWGWLNQLAGPCRERGLAAEWASLVDSQYRLLVDGGVPSTLFQNEVLGRVQVALARP